MTAKKQKDFPYDVFLSHSSIDKPWISNLYDLLTRDGFEVFYDKACIGHGSNIPLRVLEGLRDSRYICLAMSPEAFRSEWVRLEFSKAIQRDPDNSSGILKPIYLRDVDERDLFLVNHCKYIDFRHKEEFDDRYKELVDALGKPARPVFREAEVKAGTLPLNNLSEAQISRNKFFVGRKDLLFQLHVKLAVSRKRTVIAQVFAGTGGIGKTQLASEYCYRFGYLYEGVFWVNADDAHALTSYASLAPYLGLDLPEDLKPIDAVPQVRAALSEKKRTLLVLDNVENVKLAWGLVPGGGCRTLMTSRRKDFPAAHADIVKVEELEPEAARGLIVSRRQDIVISRNRKTLDRIAERLGHHPLALELSAAYLGRFKDVSLREYLRMIEEVPVTDKKSPISGEVPEDATGTRYRLDVARSFAVSLDKIREKSAMEVLSVAAFCDPDAIPIDLLSDAAGISREKTRKVLGKLNDLSILSYQKTVSIHRLMQEVVRERIGEEKGKSAVQRLLAALVPHFKKATDYRNWAKQDQYGRHVLASTHWAERWKLGEPTGFLSNQAGIYFRYRALYREAEVLFRRAVEFGRTFLGTTHPHFAAYLNNLAGLYRAQGKYEKAEPLYMRALEIREKIVGKNHPDVATSLNNLALLYHYQGKYEEAKLMYKRALEIDEKALGKNHPHVATRLNNLAGLYSSQEKYSEAEPLYKRALEIREKILEKNHPDVSTSLNNLAGLYYDQGKYSDAEPLFKRALKIREKALGSEHPDVATVLKNLAVLYQEMGKKTQAERLLKRARAIRKKTNP